MEKSSFEKPVVTQLIKATQSFDEIRCFITLSEDTLIQKRLISKRISSENLGINGSITLRLILGKQCWSLWIGFIWLSIGTIGGLL
jgi:hypothetical protein